MTGRNPIYRQPPTSWQPPPRCECAQLRCRLARAEAERDDARQVIADLTKALVDMRSDLEVAGA